jgi:hypothetical protein
MAAICRRRRRPSHRRPFVENALATGERVEVVCVGEERQSAFENIGGTIYNARRR